MINGWNAGCTKDKLFPKINKIKIKIIKQCWQLKLTKTKKENMCNQLINKQETAALRRGCRQGGNTTTGNEETCWENTGKRAKIMMQMKCNRGGWGLEGETGERNIMNIFMQEFPQENNKQEQQQKPYRSLSRIYSLSVHVVGLYYCENVYQCWIKPSKCWREGSS